ncbi:MAG: IS200/IS605 family transposase [Chloroflexota bacterium]|nr:IS200/IS605 family transposase [Chloroflexota bacterium]
MAFWRVYYHLVWATKNRQPFIRPKIRSHLYAYITNKAAELGVYVYAIGGWCDHVHVVVAIPPKHAVAYVVKRLKGASAHEMNRSGECDYHFAWQRGYGVLSCGENQKEIAVAYVKSQERHHKNGSANPWLEHYIDFDEGPSETGLAREDASPAISEQPESYTLSGELPF